jgi:hypothetical protein
MTWAPVLTRSRRWPLAFGVCLLSWFGYEACQDLRAFATYKETSCVVIDARRLPPQVVKSPGRAHVIVQTIIPYPVFTFSYQAGHRDYVMRADTSSTLAWLSRPSLVPSDARIGDVFPCWYDERRPDHAVLLRLVSPLYAAVIFPIWLIWSHRHDLLPSARRRAGTVPSNKQISGRATARMELRR